MVLPNEANVLNLSFANEDAQRDGGCWEIGLDYLSPL
jgi:hypothetical protein